MRILGKLQIVFGMNADQSKVRMVTVPHSTDTWRDEPFLLKNASITCDEISFDDSWWQHNNGAVALSWHAVGVQYLFNANGKHRRQQLVLFLRRTPNST